MSCIHNLACILPRTTQVNLYCDEKSTTPVIVAYGDDLIRSPSAGDEWIYVSCVTLTHNVVTRGCNTPFGVVEQSIVMV